MDITLAFTTGTGTPSRAFVAYDETCAVTLTGLTLTGTHYLRLTTADGVHSLATRATIADDATVVNLNNAGIQSIFPVLTTTAINALVTIRHSTTGAVAGTAAVTITPSANPNADLTYVLLDAATTAQLALLQAEVDTIETCDSTIRTVTHEPTGFANPELVVVTGVGGTTEILFGTVTLSGTVVARVNGIVSTVIIDGWRSVSHGRDTDVAYVLRSADGVTAEWVDYASVTFTNFQHLLISIAFYDPTAATWVYTRECHGLQDWQSHENDHDTIGTYKTSGGTLADYTVDSETAADRRPSVSATGIKDEDLATLNALLAANGPYTQLSLTGATGTPVFTAGNDIVALSTAQPYWNEFDSTWQQTLVADKRDVSVWLMELPMAADAASQRLRHCWMQGQSTGKEKDETARTPASLSLGTLEALAPERIFVSHLVLEYKDADWEIKSVTQIDGTRYSQTSSPQGNALTAVSTDDSLTGDGTAADPLAVGPFADNLPLTLGTDSDYSWVYNSATDNLELVHGATVGTDIRLTMDAAGNLSLPSATAGIYFGAFADHFIGPVDGNLVFDSQEVGTGDFYFKNGNVGIGTATPTQKLEVSDLTGANISLNSKNLSIGDGDDLGNILFTGSDTGVTAGSIGAKISGEAAGTWGEDNDYPTELQFWTSANSGTATKRIVMDRDGNLQIIADNKKLLFGAAQDASIYYDGTDMVFNSQDVGTGDFIFKSVSPNLVLRASKNATWTVGENAANIQFFTSDASAPAGVNSSIGLEAESVAGSHYGIVFRNGGNTGQNQEKMRIAHGGNIIISNDNAKLLFGAAQDASIYYNGTGLVINPKEVGSGRVVVDGSIEAVYKTTDGTSAVADGAYTTGIGATTNGTITIKDGLITALTQAVA